MSNYNSLKATIDANIKQNGNQEITGQILNSVLNQMVNILGTGYQFAGVATIDTNPGTPDAKVFYIANGKGTYEKFGGINVTEDDVVVLYYDTAWHKVSTGIASQAKLSELKSDTKYVLDNITIGAVASMARKLYTNDVTATYATDFTRVGYYKKDGTFVSDSNYRTSARFQLPRGGYLFEFYTETQIIGCIRISDADDNTVRMLTQDGLNCIAGGINRFLFLYSSLDKNLYLEISRFVGASEYPKIYTAMDGTLTTKEYVDGQLSESLNGLMMQRIILTHDKIVNSEFYDGYYWSSYNERTALDSYTCGKVDLTSLRGRYIILNPGFVTTAYIPGYSYIQKQDGTILALSKIPATQFERVPIIKTFNNDKCILLYVDSSYSTLIWSKDKNRMPEFAVISGVTPSVAAELATQSSSISDLSSSISDLSLLINSVDNRTYFIESSEQIDFPESNNGKYIESNGNIHEAISTTGEYRLSDSILVNVGDKFIIHAGSYNSAILALYSSTNQLLDIIFRSTSQNEYYDNVYEVKNPNAHHIVFGYQRRIWGASKFNYATTTPLNEVVAQLKTQIESSESTLSGKTIFLFGDSISSSDYTWYVEYLQKYTGARVLNQGASGRNAAYQASNEYFTRLANNPADVVVALVGGNDSGASGTIGTFGSNTALAQMGESVVTETDIADDYNGTKYIQAVSHIIRKWRATYWNFRLAAGLTANILDTQNNNAVVYPTTGTATEQQCIDYAATQGWTLGYGQRYVMMTTETDAAKRTKLMAVKQPKLYFCTTLPQKRYNDESPWSNPENWERKRLAIIECCQKYGINCIDLAKDFAIDWSKEPYWPGQGYTGTSKTDNQGIYTMDGLHPNEFGYEWIARIVSKVIK